MHRRVGWMMAADPSILEYMAIAKDAYNNPAKQTPKTISLNTGYSRKHVGNRCRVLADRGLLERIDRGVYRITDSGIAAVEKEIDPEDL